MGDGLARVLSKQDFNADACMYISYSRIHSSVEHVFVMYETTQLL